MVGQVLAPYDPDQKFPVFGYAGFPCHMSELSKKEMYRPHHGFPVNGKPYAPEVDGLDGILAAYKNSIEEKDLKKKIGAAGVSNLAELLVEFKKYTVRNTAKKQYQILLVLTPGINNYNHRKFEIEKALQELSLEPASVIIVGVDDNAVGKMRFDDYGFIKDKRPSHKKEHRDLFQYLPFRKSVKKGNLAEKVLEDIPDQISEYFKRTNYEPEDVPQEI